MIEKTERGLAPSRPQPQSAERVILALCAAALMIAILDLIGWWLHRPALVGFFAGYATMKPNTALLSFVLALATLGKRSDRRTWSASNALCGFAILLTAATLFEYGTGHDLGIDNVLAKVPPEVSGDPVGRMALGTTIDGLLTAASLLVLDLVPLLSPFLLALGLLTSMSALVGVLFDAGPLLGVPLLRSMALRTGGTLFAVQLAAFLLRPEREPTRSLLHTVRFHRTGIWFLLGSCLSPLAVGLPIAYLYRHGIFDASFSLALLVVLLIAMQALLVSRNSHSLTLIEEKRDRAEQARSALAEENTRHLAELVRSEQQAAQREAQYRLITDMLPTYIAYLDTNLRYLRVNRTYEQWFGMTATEMEGRTFQEVWGETASELQAHLRLALRGEAQFFETSMNDGAHGTRFLSVSHIPEWSPDGHVLGVVAQGHDITTRKQAEQALRQTEKLAAVGRLASSIAHEINNPLEAVTNLLYLARAADEVPAIQQFLEVAEDEVRRISAIASQTLRFHKQATRPVKVTAPELLESVLAIYRSRLQNMHVSVEERYKAKGSVVCLEGEIRQVLNNLVGNGIDAMGRSGGRLLLRSRDMYSFRHGCQGLLVTVADTGTGMSAKTLTTLYEPFFTTKGMNGTGLGLWVSKEIVDRHRGSLQVRSSEMPGNSGTVFRLFLPSEFVGS